MSEDKDFTQATGQYIYEPGPDGFYRIRKPNGKLFLPNNLAQVLNSAKLQKFRKYAYIEGNILVVQHPPGMGNPEFESALQDFTNVIYAQLGINPVVIAVAKLSDITMMDEERMEKYGWVKKSRVLMFKEEMWQKNVLTEKEEEE